MNNDEQDNLDRLAIIKNLKDFIIQGDTATKDQVNALSIDFKDFMKQTEGAVDAGIRLAAEAESNSTGTTQSLASFQKLVNANFKTLYTSAFRAEIHVAIVQEWMRLVTLMIAFAAIEPNKADLQWILFDLFALTREITTSTQALSSENDLSVMKEVQKRISDQLTALSEKTTNIYRTPIELPPTDQHQDVRGGN